MQYLCPGCGGFTFVLAGPAAVGDGWLARAVAGTVDTGGWQVVARWLVGWWLARWVNGPVGASWEGGALEQDCAGQPWPPQRQPPRPELSPQPPQARRAIQKEKGKDHRPGILPRIHLGNQTARTHASYETQAFPGCAHSPEPPTRNCRVGNRRVAIW